MTRGTESGRNTGAITRLRHSVGVPIGMLAIGTAGISKILWETAQFVGGEDLNSQRDENNTLDEYETGCVVASLYDGCGLSFGDIAMCFPRDRQWVRETYEDHPTAKVNRTAENRGEHL